MLEIIREINLDVSEENRFTAITAKQYDSRSRYLLVRLTDRGEALTLPDTASVLISATRPDGLSDGFEGLVQDGAALVPLDYWMLMLDGTVTCELVVTGADGYRLTTMSFSLDVRHSCFGDGLTPGGNHGVYVRLLEEIEELKKKIGEGLGGNGTVTDEQISAAVEKYLTEHPIESPEVEKAAESAKKSAEDADASASEAKTVADEAGESARTADRSASSAAESASLAASSAESAESSASAAQTAKEGAETAMNEAAQQATNAGNAAQEAATAATGAAEAKTAAQTARQAAETAKSGAEQAATNASASAGTAGESATTAQNAAQSAVSAKEAVETAKTAAEGARDEAGQQATTAADAAQTATGKATEAAEANAAAQTAKGEAQTAATNAGKSATAAAGSATTASNAATAAQTARGKAEAAQAAAESAKAEVEQKLANGDYKGKDGKSAYEIYKDHGGALTEAQWLASLVQSPLFVENEIPADADKERVYVKLPSNQIWGYYKKNVLVETNRLDLTSADTVVNNYIDGNEVALTQAGHLATNFIPYDYSALSQLTRADKFYVKLAGVPAGINSVYKSTTAPRNATVIYYDASKTRVGWMFIRYYASSIKDILPAHEDEQGNVLIDPTTRLLTGYGSWPTDFTAVKYIRLGINPTDSTTALVADDYKDIRIYVIGEEYNATIEDWYDTGLIYPPSDSETDLVEINNQLSDHELRIKDLEVYGGSGGSGSAIPAYWEDAVVAAEAKIQALHEEGGADCVSFVWASDTHCGGSSAASGRYSTPVNVGRVVSRLMADLDIPLFAVTGDLAADVGGVDSFPDKADINTYFDKIVQPVGVDRVLSVLGNHDGTTYRTDGDLTLTKAERFNWFMRHFGGDRNRVWGGGEYYYTDHPQSKTRFIALCGYNGTTNIYRQHHYDAPQLKWLAEEALDAPNGYTVVILTHAPSDGSELGGSPSNSEALLAILTAARNKTAYSATVDGVEISKDYANTGVTVCGIFAGHVHEDYINTEHGYPIVTVDCAGNQTAHQTDGVYRTFTANSSNESCLDVVTINKATKTIHMTRLGVGEDRTATY